MRTYNIIALLETLVRLLKCVTSWAELKSAICNFTVSENRRVNLILRGSLFEVFCKYYLLFEPSVKFKRAWLSKEIPSNIRQELGLKEKGGGFDLLLETSDGKYAPVECKFRNIVTTRLSWSGKFVRYLIILVMLALL